MAVRVLWIFLVAQWVSLHCVIVVFPDHTHSYIFATRTHHTIGPTYANFREIKTLAKNFRIYCNKDTHET